MKKISIIISCVFICSSFSEGADKELRFEYFRPAHASEIPDKYRKADYDNSMRKPALLSMLQSAIRGVFSHDEFVSFTRGIMINLPVFDEELYVFEKDFYQMGKNMFLLMNCSPQKECSGRCVLDFDDEKKMESQYNFSEISKLIYLKKVSAEIEWAIYLKLIDENEPSYNKALEYALSRIVEYIRTKEKQDLNFDDQENLAALRRMVQLVITRMSIRQLYDSFMTMKEKSTAWYLMKDFSEDELKELIYESSLNDGANGVYIYACPEKWKQQAEKWSVQSMAENWHREIRCFYPDKTGDLSSKQARE